MNVSYLTLVEQFATSEQLVLVIGDIMLDRYLTGEVSRISPEAPVPVVLLNHADERLGGAANVVANLRGLGIKTKLLGVIGDDSFGQILVTKLDAVGTDTRGIVVSKSRPTTNKIRVVSAGHQIVRVDEECIHPLNDDESQALLGEFQQALATQPSLVVLSDYAKGVLDSKH
ncbi:MAG: PfkB family carbohydrate kinase, partial [Methylophilaceae bacterium]|nr:PfkB family carbohydrate kinase [Methylophilaceae bacterium]